MSSDSETWPGSELIFWQAPTRAGVGEEEGRSGCLSVLHPLPVNDTQGTGLQEAKLCRWSHPKANPSAATTSKDSRLHHTPASHGSLSKSLHSGACNWGKLPLIPGASMQGRLGKLVSSLLIPRRYGIPSEGNSPQHGRVVHKVTDSHICDKRPGGLSKTMVRLRVRSSNRASKGGLWC